MRITLLTAAVILVGCDGAAPEAQGVTADPAILRGALGDWQEGPTDGRVCLDPHVLPAPGDTAGVPRRWAESVLNVLLADTLVALDTTAAPPLKAEQRACASSDDHHRIVLGIPIVRGDSAEMVSAAFLSGVTSDPARERRLPVILKRRGNEWFVSRRPGQQFIELRPPG